MVMRIIHVSICALICRTREKKNYMCNPHPHSFADWPTLEKKRRITYAQKIVKLHSTHSLKKRQQTMKLIEKEKII